MSRRKTTSSLELWILHEVQGCGGYYQVPKGEGQNSEIGYLNFADENNSTFQAEWKFLQNDCSYNLFMMPSLRYIVSV